MTLYFRGMNRRGGEVQTVDYNIAELFTFPGGEVHLRKLKAERYDVLVADLRGADPQELIGLGLFEDAFAMNFPRMVALIPYLPAARSDRGFPCGGSVYSRILNSFKFDRVIALDPHSEYITNQVNNLVVADVKPLIMRALRESATYSIDNTAGVIAPDKGARKRAEAMAEVLGVPVYQAWKKRDEETGKLTGFGCEDLPDTDDGIFLVVDDICDGGGTFMGLAESTGLDREQLALWVTHGIFSGSAPLLNKHYGHIFTTDSHPGHNRDSVATTIVPTEPYLTKRIGV